MGSFLLGLLGGFIAWRATDSFLRPLTKFFVLRTETAEALALYEGHFNPDPDALPPSSEWLAERKLAYEQCGAGLLAFCTSHSFIAQLLHQFPLRSFRYHTRSAGSNMRALAETLPGTEPSDHFRRYVVYALKLGDRPWPERRRRR